jgi:hypothetical protein
MSPESDQGLALGGAFPRQETHDDGGDVPCRRPSSRILLHGTMPPDVSSLEQH